MSNGNTVRDGFDRYYTERIWQLIPEVYRNEDGIAANPGALRRIVELIGAEAARSRRSIDRLWEDQNIETCDDWAVPYIGDLVGTRLVSALDRRGRRVDVANTIRFRRRRGTPDVLDTLARAMSGWDVVLVEGFRRLARTRHRLDPPPRDDAFFTGTLSGGTADLRSPAGAEIADGPFDEYLHTLDTRLLRGRDGRFGITKLNFHLYRMVAYEMTDVDPVLLTDPDGLGFLRTFTVDPSGRDIPLFVDAEPPDPDAVAALPGLLSRPTCGLPREWEVTQAIRCRLLGHVVYQITASIIAALRALANPPSAMDEQALFQLLETRFYSEPDMRRRLTDLGAAIPANVPDWYRSLVALSLLARTGKASLYPSQIEISSAGVPFLTAQISSANLTSLLCHPDPEGVLATLVISPELGRFATVPAGLPANFDPRVDRYHYGFSGDVGAGPYLRDPIPAADVPSRTAVGGVVPDGGILQGDGLLINDNQTYSLSIVNTTPVGPAVLQAGPQRRPYVVFSGGGATLQPQAIGSTFLIDGGWYGVNDPSQPSAPGAMADFVIEGAAGAAADEYDFEQVEMRFATFDPGGARADGVRVPALRLLVRARIRRLIVRRSIMGPIHVIRDNPADPSTVDQLLICESLIDASQTTDRLAISTLFGAVVIESSTILGDIVADVLKASDTIVDGRVTVVNNQAGCFRFSASEPGDGVTLPPRYRDVFEPIPPYIFNSTRFGDPQYGQLSVVAPDTIAKGAENGSEMGVFSFLLNPIRLASVRAKVNEFGPVGVLAQYLFEGEFQPESLVRPGTLPPEPPPVEAPAPPSPGDIIPEPEPMPPPPLPTTCPDQEAPAPGPHAPERITPIDLTSVNINGAPAFWRNLTFRLDTLSPTGTETREGIPFDPARVVLEYDARFGTIPSEQGWMANSPGSEALYWLDDSGALKFDIPQGPALFTSEAALGEEPIPQVHAYVNVLFDNVVERPRDPAEAFERQVEGFEHQVEANESGQPFRGLRAEWAGVGRRLKFHYVTLDRKQIILSPRLPGELLGNWHTVSLEGDYRNNHALLSIDGQIVELKLGKFGVSAGAADRSILRASFGIWSKAGRTAGRIRNFVVSTPGRFIRAWMGGRVPGKSPALRLGFATDSAAGGTARFRVRYGRAHGRAGSAIPLRLVGRTLDLHSLGIGKTATLEFPLTAARPNDDLVIAVERDGHHQQDTANTTVRLIKAEIVSQGGTR